MSQNEGKKFIAMYSRSAKQHFQGVIGKITKVTYLPGRPKQESKIYYDPLFIWGGFEPDYSKSGSAFFIRGAGFDQRVIMDPEDYSDVIIQQIFEMST